MQALSDDGLPDLRPKRQESQRTMKQLAEHEEKRAQRVKRYEEVAATIDRDVDQRHWASDGNAS
jgi:hypothetical protein